MVRHHVDGILQKGKYGNTVCAISAGRISGRIFDMKDNFCITNEYSIIRKGSFTIETACVMPLILLVLMGLIYLSFFVHNRAWLTAAAYESAVSGSMEGIKKNGEIYLVIWQSELAFEDRREIRSDKSGETYPQTAGGAGGTERNGGIE